jgi:hypothetical protein
MRRSAKEGVLHLNPKQQSKVSLLSGGKPKSGLLRESHIRRGRRFTNSRKISNKNQHPFDHDYKLDLEFEPAGLRSSIAGDSHGGMMACCLL